MEFNSYLIRSRLFLIVFMGLLTVGSTKAQRFSEWFRQKKTQKKYLLAQMAALETYIKAVEKGYGIARDGLSAVSDVKEGDFMQHMLHFQSLEMVSPRVKNYSKVLSIAEMEDRSDRFRRAVLAEKGLRIFLNERELAGLRQAFNAADTEANKDLETLELLVADDGLKMTDDERITHIDQLYLEVKEKGKAVLNLGRNVQRLIGSRQKQKNDVRLLEQLYGK